GQFVVESVVSFPWNRWSVSAGIRGQFGPEYAGQWQILILHAYANDRGGIQPVNTLCFGVWRQMIEDWPTKGVNPAERI
ncbi:hypothetical protein, partial [Desulfomicrobium norvegicum]|uniref:hypothetical protein n=1 Tax=Desulfomicrobium norvegicum (strain DSM 1741 / NCIMB 8310) TaxID=52561 RepID=UPI001ABF38B1